MTRNHTHGEINTPRTAPDEPGANQLVYKEAIESVQYATTISQPDIRYTTRMLEIYHENLSLEHWAGVNQILWYLRGTVSMLLCLHNGVGTSQTGLVSYVGAAYAEDHKDSKSTSGILIKYSDCTIYWRSKRQTSTASFTAEVEINFVALGLVEASWLRKIVGEILNQTTDLMLVNDNQVFLVNLDGWPYRPGNRHLEERFHWIRKKVRKRFPLMRYKHTNTMTANGFTKAFDRIKYLHFCKVIQLEVLGESRFRKIRKFVIREGRKDIFFFETRSIVFLMAFDGGSQSFGRDLEFQQLRECVSIVSCKSFEA